MSNITTKTNRPGYYGKGSVEVAPPSSDDEGPTRRLAISADKLVTRPFEGIDTVYDVLEYVAKTHGTRDALGWRDVLAVHEEEKEVSKIVEGKEVKEKKKWKYFELSGYKYISYVGLKERVGELARGLVDLGLTNEDVFNIFAATSVNWQLIAHACGSISTRIATAYDTLGPSGLTHSLNEPSCAALFTNASLLPTLLKVLPNTPTVKFVIYDADTTTANSIGKILTQVKEVRPDIQLLSIDELRERGKGVSESVLEGEAADAGNGQLYYVYEREHGRAEGGCDYACESDCVAAVYTLLGHHLTPEDAYLAYLPLAHILEYIVELIMLFVGMPTGFGGVKVGFPFCYSKKSTARRGGLPARAVEPEVGWVSPTLERWTGFICPASPSLSSPSPSFHLFCTEFTLIGLLLRQTLTDASVRNCDGDIKAFRPSIMVGVPAVWETIRKGIVGKVAGGGRVRESVFRGAVEAKKKNTPVLGKLADSVILSSVRAATGGRLRIAMSGGASISRETQEFLSVALVMLLQGYGMTESCGMCAIMPPEVFRYDTVGLPVPSIEIKRHVLGPVAFPFSHRPGDRRSLSFQTHLLSLDFDLADFLLPLQFRDVPEAGYFSCGRNGATEERGRAQGALSVGGEEFPGRDVEAFFATRVVLVDGRGSSGSPDPSPRCCDFRARPASIAFPVVSLLPPPSLIPRVIVVCIRGPSVISGYFKRPDLNEDPTIFAGDGWMRTGDVGQWNADGTLTLIDRIKNLVKLAGGEYIALEQLESTYKSCNYVANICVHATQDAKAPIAIIIPNEGHLRAALKGVDGIDVSKGLPELCTDPRVAEVVLKECNAVGKKNGFKAMETLSAVILTPDEWTPESGLVTAAQKIQRSAIAKKFDKEIKEAYKNQ
ncbi:Long-chain-fatty-acid-CoA ligase [Mycena venus]|uniref:Long-chain-fatty-acid-CoA ligase n=1 Tax=Mycena venus TaxID=2733690 RepID=A0A8H7CPX2_9AGAR|nr:Long-chain-fatty-acid-CoA ligase [Mycena venus]